MTDIWKFKFIWRCLLHGFKESVFYVVKTEASNVPYYFAKHQELVSCILQAHEC